MADYRYRLPFFLRRWFQVLVGLTFLGIIAGLIALWIFLAPFHDRAYAFDFTQIDKLEHASIIYDREGAELGRIFVLNRDPVPLEQIPWHVIQALVAIEDSRFFEHNGVDWMGVVRATLRNLRARETRQGASTITQQLARNAFNMTERSYERKLVEAFLAYRIEQTFTKSEIMEMYLNRIYFGSGFYGVNAAAKGYFGKEVSKITVDEAATLCGLIKSPNRLSPINNPEESKKARNYVLKRMAEEKMITESESIDYQKLPIAVFKKREERKRAFEYAYEQIRQQVIQQIGFEDASLGGYHIYTTIDSNVQIAAQQAVAEHLEAVEKHEGYKGQTLAQFDEILATWKRKDQSSYEEAAEAANRPKPEYLQGAVLVIDNKTGAIRAMAGGRDFEHSNFDRSTLSRRKSGTAFTPFVFGAGFARGQFSGTKVEDEPLDNKYVQIGASGGILGEWGGETYEWKGHTLQLMEIENPSELPAEGVGVVIVAKLKGADTLHFRIFDSEGTGMLDAPETVFKGKEAAIVSLRSKLSKMWGKDQFEDKQRDSIIQSVVSLSGITRYKREGIVTARRALIEGKNAATVRFGLNIGVDEVVDFASNAGFVFGHGLKLVTVKEEKYIPTGSLDVVVARVGENRTLHFKIYNGNGKATLDEPASKRLSAEEIQQFNAYLEPYWKKGTTTDAPFVPEDPLPFVQQRTIITELTNQIKYPLPINETQKYNSTFLGNCETSLREMALAYTIFPNLGKRPRETYLVEAIRDSSGNKVYSADRSSQVNVLDPYSAYQVHNALRDTLDHGTGSKARNEYGLGDFPAAGKTGTAYDFKDDWFAGYTDKLTCVVWAGFDSPRPIYDGAFSNLTVLPIWTDIMNEAAKIFEPAVIRPPLSAKEVEICNVSGDKATEHCHHHHRNEDGTEVDRRDTHKEFLDPNKQISRLCAVHGPGGIVNRNLLLPIRAVQIASVPGDGSPTNFMLNVQPVYMQAATVIGNDPYDSIQPTIRPRVMAPAPVEGAVPGANGDTNPYANQPIDPNAPVAPAPMAPPAETADGLPNVLGEAPRAIPIGPPPARRIEFD